MCRKQNKDYCSIDSSGSFSVSYWTDLDLDLSYQFVGFFFFLPYFCMLLKE